MLVKHMIHAYAGSLREYAARAITLTPGRTSMAPDLLSTIRREIDERLNELRPLLAEHERLLVAADALVVADRQGIAAVAEKPATSDGRRGGRAGAGRRGSTAGAIELAAAGPGVAGLEGGADAASTLRSGAIDARPGKGRERSTAKAKPERAARSAAREAILGALEHGSHTVGELAVVTAMSGPAINGSLRRLAAEGVVVKAEREGKAAWALADAAG
jgi:hypothetical protein